MPFIIDGNLNAFVWYDALPIVGALLFMCSVAQKTVRPMRYFMLANVFVYMTYNVLIRSTQFFAQIASMISILTALFRYRSKPAAEKSGPG